MLRAAYPLAATSVTWDDLRGIEHDYAITSEVVESGATHVTLNDRRSGASHSPVA